MTGAASPRVAILSTSDIVGGAAQTAYRLYRALRAAGASVDLIVRDRKSADAGVRVYDAPRGLGGWRARRRESLIADLEDTIARRPPGYEPFSLPDAVGGKDLARALGGYDVVNLHWVANFVDLDAVRAMAARAHVVWTLHDMNPFTGGCHYDDHCGRYRIGCGACPQLGSEALADPSARGWAKRRETIAAIAADRITFVAPSRWIAAAAQESPIAAGRSMHVIPNGVDLDRFHDRRSPADRARFGIAADAHVVLFVAHYLSNRRKGLERLLAALGRMAPRLDPVLLVLGHDPPPAIADHRVIHVPFTHDEAAIASVYRAADVVAVPSLQDNLPNTAVEALASGTPVVASAIGGMNDIVDDGVTGILTRTEDASAFAAALSQLLDDDALRRAMGRRAREAAERRFALDRFAAAYRGLFTAVA